MQYGRKLSTGPVPRQDRAPEVVFLEGADWMTCAVLLFGYRNRHACRCRNIRRVYFRADHGHCSDPRIQYNIDRQKDR